MVNRPPPAVWLARTALSATVTDTAGEVTLSGSSDSSVGRRSRGEPESKGEVCSCLLQKPAERRCRQNQAPNGGRWNLPRAEKNLATDRKCDSIAEKLLDGRGQEPI